MDKRKSDLIIEDFGIDASSSIASAYPEVYERLGFSVHSARRDESRYHTIVTGRLWLSPIEDRRRCIRLLGALLTEYLHSVGVCREARVLFAGIGNPGLASDALGCLVCDRIVVTRGDRALTGLGFPEIAAVKPNVSSRTGLDTAEHIALLAEHIDADVIVTVDAVAARTKERLQTVIQITDAGISPGSAMSRSRAALNRETMHRPVISIGVPTVIRAELLDEAFAEETMLVTRAETDTICDCYAEVIAGAVNLAFSAGRLRRQGK